MKIKELRERLGLSQKQVAEKLNIRYGTYQNYELNRRQPDINMQIKLADFFHCSLDELVGRENCDVLNLNMLHKEEREIIENVRKLNHDNLMKVHSYIVAKLEDQDK